MYVGLYNKNVSREIKMLTVIIQSFDGGALSIVNCFGLVCREGIY